jgi:hypothetical protein
VGDRRGATLESAQTSLAALSGSTSAKTATAYSIGQQLIISAWDVIFAIVLVAWVFGWSGGKELVESSYGEAKERSRELRKRRPGSDAESSSTS